MITDPMKNTILALAALTFLIGCDAAKEAMSDIVKDDRPMTLIINAGTKVQLDGKVVPIFGNDLCPSADKVMKALFGQEPHEGQRSCVVIAPETQTVHVMVGGDDRPLQERWAVEIWTVERDGDKTMLRRDDGSYVKPVK